jgi:hypothetical protein
MRTCKTPLTLACMKTYTPLDTREMIALLDTAKLDLVYGKRDLLIQKIQ